MGRQASTCQQQLACAEGGRVGGRAVVGHTQLGQHAAEDGKGGGRLLVELPEGGPRQLLQVVGQLVRGLRGRHGCGRALFARATQRRGRCELSHYRGRGRPRCRGVGSGWCGSARWDGDGWVYSWWSVVEVCALCCRSWMRVQGWRWGLDAGALLMLLLGLGLQGPRGSQG